MTTDLDVELITLDDSDDECCNLRITAVSGSNGTTATPPRPPFGTSSGGGGGKDVGGGNTPKAKTIVRLTPIPVNKVNVKLPGGQGGNNSGPVTTVRDNNNTLPNVKLASEDQDVEEIVIDSSSGDEDETTSVKLNRADCANRTCDSSTITLKKESKNKETERPLVERVEQQNVGNVSNPGEGSSRQISFGGDANAALDALYKVLKPPILKIKLKNKLKKKMTRKYAKLVDQPKELHQNFANNIFRIVAEIKEHPFAVWELMEEAIARVEPEKFVLTTPINFDEVIGGEGNLEDLKRKKFGRLEKMLNKLSMKIKKLDERDVDWDTDDEINSSYMMRERMMKMYNKIYNELCDLDKASKLTGRPIQKAISLESTTKYPDVEKAVEKFINSRGYFFSPDFTDILEIVRGCNSELHLMEPVVWDLARDLHRSVIERRQRRRGMDMQLAFPSTCDELPEDPAEKDPDLEEKLANNIRLRRTERDVIEEFATKQGNEVAVEESQENTDDEKDDDEDEEGEGDDEGRAEAASQNENKTDEDLGSAESGPQAGEEPLFDIDDDSDQESESGRRPSTSVSDLSISTTMSSASKSASEVLSGDNKESKCDTINDQLPEQDDAPASTNTHDSSEPLTKRARVEQGTL